MKVEWDERERLENLRTDGVDFMDAALIFATPWVEAEDTRAENTRAENGEQRFRAVGRVDDETFMVAYTWRGNHRQIIGAWKVDREGQRRYAAIPVGES